MKLLRVGTAGAERPALLDEDGTLRDLSGLVPDIDGALLADDAGARPGTGRGRDAGELPALDADGAADRAAARPDRQDRVHRAELPRPRRRDRAPSRPAEPIVFMKAPDTVVGPYDTVLVPRGSREDRLGGRAGGRHRPYGPLSGVRTRRRWRTSPGTRSRTTSPSASSRSSAAAPGTRARTARRSTRSGPWLVTADEVPDPQALGLRLWVNGELKQDGTTADQIFPVAEVVRYVSQFMTLYPGDVINTGTPAGVAHGAARSRSRILRAGDVVELEIDGAGPAAAGVMKSA